LGHFPAGRNDFAQDDFLGAMKFRLVIIARAQRWQPDAAGIIYFDGVHAGNFPLTTAKSKVKRLIMTLSLLSENYLSFFDKKDLTNGMDGFISMHMNANEISPKTNSRLDRIQKFSGIFRTIFLIVAILCAVAGFFLNIALLTSGTHKITFILSAGVEFACAACAWFCYKLFNLYSQGDLFTPKAVCYIRRIGYTYFLMTVVSFFAQIVPAIQVEKIALIPQPNHVELSGLLMKLAISSFPAFLIIFVAWIMDEGRKIQEEQELTV
jgi:hypothetical protein